MFIAYRTAYSLMALTNVDDCGVMDINRVKTFFSETVCSDDMLEGMTRALSSHTN